MREGTRVASIETGLAAAAAKLSQQVRRGEGEGHRPARSLLRPPGLRFPKASISPPHAQTP